MLGGECAAQRRGGQAQPVTRRRLPPSIETHRSMAMGIGAGALSHAVYEQSIIPVRERELARMRIAQINDCPI